MLKSNKADLRKRGWVSDLSISKYKNLSNDALLEYLNSIEPTKRTIAAHIIRERGERVFVEALISALYKEKKLYSKLAISKAIARFGSVAVTTCIPHLGKVGKNQHSALPDKPFLKNNYPLPRDIIARTICRTGELAIPLLMKSIDIDNFQQLSEGIDAIGYISYYSKNAMAQNFILTLLDYHSSNSLIVWKGLRALQAFPGEQTISFLNAVIAETSIMQHCWEAERSLKRCLEKISQ